MQQAYPQRRILSVACPVRVGGGGTLILVLDGGGEGTSVLGADWGTPLRLSPGEPGTSDQRVPLPLLKVPGTSEKGYPLPLLVDKHWKYNFPCTGGKEAANGDVGQKRIHSYKNYLIRKDVTTGSLGWHISASKHHLFWWKFQIFFLMKPSACLFTNILTTCSRNGSVETVSDMRIRPIDRWRLRSVVEDTCSR